MGKDSSSFGYYVRLASSFVGNSCIYVSLHEANTCFVYDFAVAFTQLMARKPPNVANMTERALLAGRNNHRRMSSAEQARISQGRHPQNRRSAGYNSRNNQVPRTTAAPSRGGAQLGTQVPTRSAGAGAYTERRKKKSRSTILRTVLIVLAVVLIGGGTAAALYINDISARLTSGLNTEQSSALREVLSDDVSLDDPFYMLLLGVDKSQERVESDEFGSSDSDYRSDTIILARIDAPAQKVTLVSIPRDTQVEMGSYGTQKINAAYSLGGPALCTQIVSELAGVEISHYAEVDFEQLTNIVDTIGGIEVDLPIAVVDDMADVDLPAGEQTINGAQALGLCRSRHNYDDYGGGDFFRAANQRMVIGAIVKKILAQDIVTMTSTVSNLASSVTIDDTWSATDILNLALQFRNLDPDNSIYSGQLPTISSYENSLWYEKVNTTKWTKMMERVKAGESPYEDESEDFTRGIAGTTGNGVYTTDVDSEEATYSGSVLVLNATNIQGYAANTCTTLNAKGFTATADTDSDTTRTTSIVIYNGSNLGKAKGVAETLGIDQESISKNDGSRSTKYDVVVLLGTDKATSN